MNNKAAEGYNYLQQCSSVPGTTQVCCGSDYRCCNGTEVVDVDIFTAISKAPGVTSTAFSTGGSTGSATSSTPPSTSTTSSSINGDDTRSLAVGLGVGIPLGLAFVAALVFLGLQLRRRNVAQALSAAQTGPQQPQPHTGQLYAHRGGSGGNWQQQNHWTGAQEMETHGGKLSELQGEAIAQEVPG